MLSNAELTAMREAIEDLFPDTCNILTATETADGYGGVSRVWGTASANVACRLDVVNRSGSDEQVGAASLRSFQETILSVPYNTTITTDSKVEHSGTTYNVTAINSGQSWIAVKRVTLEKV